MKKISKIISNNSNTLLIFITIAALLIMINFSIGSSRRASQNLIAAVSLYTQIIDDEIYTDPETIRNLLNKFSGEYFGRDEEDVENSLENLYNDLPLIEHEKLFKLIDSYQNLIETRLQSFDTLLYFLSAGVIIQFIFMILTSRKAEIKGEQLRNSEEVLKLLNGEREKERLRISSFLHDSILQDLGSLLLSKDISVHKEITAQLRTISDSLREVTYEIAPLQLQSTGLLGAIEDLICRKQNNKTLEIKLMHNGYSEKLLNNESRLVFYRIIQESLMNVEKHAKAKSVQIKLVTTYPYLILRIIDDGAGFTKQNTKEHDNQKHIGMLLMKEQAKSIGASLSAESSAGKGTTITLKHKLRGENQT